MFSFISSLIYLTGRWMKLICSGPNPALDALCSLILTTVLERNSHHAHFMTEETRAQRD